MKLVNIIFVPVKPPIYEKLNTISLKNNSHRPRVPLQPIPPYSSFIEIGHEGHQQHKNRRTLASAENDCYLIQPQSVVLILMCICMLVNPQFLLVTN
ncbi:hypothetical protein EG68_06135 [Paragonimus skrjabini miyazakii]|uniref:Uncharacterized protein n=1 Tax=Paragonimus skrjabini miyazakii TaxID=59628 RepID=A0A8S9YQ45_9TREM|nr:hypothetical protein EG68_06135 [Paragonimus skrjabini miyazakii]